MKKLRRNYMMGQKQLRYLDYVKDKFGISHAEFIRRLIDKEIENDHDYTTKTSRVQEPELNEREGKKI